MGQRPYQRDVLKGVMRGAVVSGGHPRVRHDDADRQVVAGTRLQEAFEGRVVRACLAWTSIAVNTAMARPTLHAQVLGPWRPERTG